MPFVQVSQLPATVRRALSAARYNRADIALLPTGSASLQSYANDGCRDFAVIINMGTGETKRIDGSWGGPNMFTTNPIDSDDRKHEIPVNGAIFLGSEGGGRPVRGSLYVRPDAVAALLPAVPGISERDASILAQYRGLTSAGRKNEWERNPKSRPTADELASLVARGLLAQNKTGAVSITTAGKNAAGKLPY